MSHFNVRVPPDSTGKRIGTTAENLLNYTSGTIAFVVGDVVTGNVSGATGEVVKVVGSTFSGHIHVLLFGESIENFANGEDLIVDSVTNATADGVGEAVHTQHAVLVSGDNTSNVQYVDDQGAAFTRYTGGSPQFDAFGKMRVSQETIIGDYLHPYNELPDKYSTEEVGGGVLSYEASSHAVLLSTGITSGDKVERTTHKYHKYQPGVSQIVMFTAAIGDAGKANVNRWMGYGDSDDGIFWTLDGTTMSVMLRNSTSGSIVETKIQQSDWNGDRLDGTSLPTTNLSGVLLDPTKDNVYWIDFQWLGAGRVRMGVIVDGDYILCHEFLNANNNPRSYMRTGSLPLNYGQENVGAAGSLSEMRLWCAAVKTEGKFEPFEIRHGHASTVTKTVDNNVTSVPLMSIQSKQLYQGFDNRVWAMLEDVQLNLVGDPIIIEFIKEPTVLTGASFADYSNVHSSLEIDTAATATSGGEVMAAGVINAGAKILPASNIFGIEKEIIMREADITIPITYTFRARTATSATTADVTIAVNWYEIP